MKFLIVLALAVVATQAAFTGSLVQQAQPLVQSLKIQSLARSSAEANFQTQFGQALNNQINNILGQIEQTVDHVQNIAQILSNSVQNAVQQGVHAGQQAVQQAQDILAGLLHSIIGAFTGEKSTRELPAALISIIQQLGQNQAVLNVIHSTQLYNCLIGKDVQIEYAHLADLYYSNQLLAAASAARPQVRECIEEQGGLESIHDQVRPFVPTIIGLLDAFNIYDLVHNTIISIIGQDLFDIYVQPVLNNKGLFSNVFGGIQQGASQLSAFIAGVAQNAIASLKEQIEKIKDLATQFVQNGIEHAQEITFSAAQQLIIFLQPYKEDMGLLYQQVVDQLSSIYTGLVLPF